jgi:branched-chain amino acid transport system substrate-binding protein
MCLPLDPARSDHRVRAPRAGAFLARGSRFARRVRNVCAALACLLLGTRAQAPSPAGQQETLAIGMSTVLSGSAKDLGLGMRAGLECAFGEYNRSLAADKPALRLVALDDGYEPDRCAPNMRQLIEREQVLAIVGNVGTPTAIAAVPIAVQSRTPFFGAFTGAGVLRKDPPERYVINYRASYAEETAAMVDGLMRCGLAPEEVAFFTQRDGYGDSGFNGGIATLKKHGLKSEAGVVHGRYERNTLAVDGALAEILLAATPPRAVIMVGTYAPCAAFIEHARAAKFTPLFLNVSFVGADSLMRALRGAGEGVAVTQVVPHYASDLPLCREYRAALALCASRSEPSSVSLEGYIVGRIFCRALRSIQAQPTRENLVDGLLSMGTFDLGLGAQLSLSQAEHQASHKVWLSVIRDGQVLPFEWDRLGELVEQR